MAEEISKTRSFLLLGGVLLADIFNNFIAFRYKELLPCSLPVFIAISHICFFIFHKCLSTYFHPPSVALATSPVPPELHVPSSWQGRLGRSLMLWFEFLTDKLGVLLLCLHLGFILHLFFLSPAEGRKELALLDPKLGRPLPEKDYGNRCNDLTQVSLLWFDARKAKSPPLSCLPPTQKPPSPCLGWGRRSTTRSMTSSCLSTFLGSC